MINRANFDLSFITYTNEFDQINQGLFLGSGDMDDNLLLVLLNDLIEGFKQQHDFDVCRSDYFNYRLYLFNLNRKEKLNAPPYPSEKFVQETVAYRKRYFEELKEGIVGKKSNNADEIKLALWYVFFQKSTTIFSDSWFLKPYLNFSEKVIELLRILCSSFNEHLGAHGGVSCQPFKKIDFLKDNEFDYFYSFSRQDIESIKNGIENTISLAEYHDVKIELEIISEICHKVLQDKIEFIFYSF